MTAESITIRRADTADLDVLQILAGAMGSAKEPGYFGTCLTEQAEGRRALFIIIDDRLDTLAREQSCQRAARRPGAEDGNAWGTIHGFQ